jgi:hypothetical protein
MRKTMKKVLINYNIFHECFAELTNRYDVIFPQGDFIDFEKVLEIIPEFDGQTRQSRIEMAKTVSNIIGFFEKDRPVFNVVS